mmetsp:Transcript_13056/g.44248  ORF Transcript_13056/g.44248 Transcript_13056/m.44248 type:complete len:451 (-) Transcript_13056:80-1432(-)
MEARAGFGALDVLHAREGHGEPLADARSHNLDGIRLGGAALVRLRARHRGGLWDGRRRVEGGRLHHRVGLARGHVLRHAVLLRDIGEDLRHGRLRVDNANLGEDLVDRLGEVDGHLVGHGGALDGAGADGLGGVEHLEEHALGPRVARLDGRQALRVLRDLKLDLAGLVGVAGHGHVDRHVGGGHARAAEHDEALGAVDHRLLGALTLPAVGGLAEAVALVAHHDGGRRVHVAAVIAALLRVPNRLHLRGLAQVADHGAERVHAGKLGDAAAHLVLKLGEREVGRRGEGEVRGDAHEVADDALLDEARCLLGRGPAVRPVALHEEEALGLSRGDDGADLERVHAHGLLAEHVLAVGKAEHDVLEVGVLVRGDVDHVHVGVPRELRVGAEALGRRGAAAVDVGHLLGALRGPARDHGDLVVRGGVDGGSELAGDAAGAEDAPAEGSGGGHG